MMSRWKLPGLEGKAPRAGFKGKPDDVVEAGGRYQKPDRIPGEAFDDHLTAGIGRPGNVDPPAGVADRSGVGKSCFNPDGMERKDPRDMSKIDPFCILIKDVGHVPLLLGLSLKWPQEDRREHKKRGQKPPRGEDGLKQCSHIRHALAPE